MFRKLIGFRRNLITFLASFIIFYAVLRFHGMKARSGDSSVLTFAANGSYGSGRDENQHQLRGQREFKVLLGGMEAPPAGRDYLDLDPTLTFPHNMGTVMGRLKSLNTDGGANVNPQADVRMGANAQPNADVQPGANVQPSADVQPGANVQPSAVVQPGANVQPSADGANRRGAVVSTTKGTPAAKTTTVKAAPRAETTANVTTAAPFTRYLVYLNDTSQYDVFLKTSMGSKLDCQNASSYDAIMAVHSAPGNVVKRQAFRWLYADFNQTNPYRIKVWFFLGQVKNSTLQSALVTENDKFGDIVQGNFMDAYGNLTYKAIFAFKWINDHCAGFRRLLRLDDDVFLRVDRFFHVWGSRVRKEQNTIMCDAMSNDKVRREGKWLVKQSEIPETKYTFQHCLGYFVALTPDLVPKMEAAARRTRFFWIDDVFMYGFVAKKVGAKFENVNRDMVRWKEKKLVSCLQTQGRKCKVLTLITKPEKFRMLYSLKQNVTKH